MIVRVWLAAGGKSRSRLSRDRFKLAITQHKIAIMLFIVFLLCYKPRKEQTVCTNSS